MTTPADELKAAAAKLRATASAVGSAPGISSAWAADGPTVTQGTFPDGTPVYPVAEAATAECAALIALMHPGVGLAVADWLDWQAAALTDGRFAIPAAALAVARQILGTVTGQPETEADDAARRADIADSVTAHTKALLARRTETLRQRAERAEAERDCLAMAVMFARQWTPSAPMSLRDGIDEILTTMPSRLADEAQQPAPVSYRLDQIRNATHLHRKGLISTSELYAVIETIDEAQQPAPAVTEETTP